ncbi:MAG TPA: cytochrome P450 [Candidatus Limnocylindrales bacterium]|nr:cytochrome P450 [Candidatus Limnocylindrales bacterium]
MPDSKPSLETIDIISHQTYADNGYPHEAWRLLRREAPVYWYERGDCIPFWAVTRLDDIVRISKNPQVFENRPRLAAFPEFDRDDEEDYPARHLLNMDPPEHAKYRRIVSSHFTPRAVERMKRGVDDITHELLDAMMAGGGTIDGDFVELFSARLPLAVLADLLGVPRADWELMFRWTNEIIGATDPEYRAEGETAEQTDERARLALFQYYAELVDERRKQPREDIITILATGKLDGEDIPPFELLSYLFLLVVAGNETTRNATTGGLLALLQNPGEMEKLRRNPGLINNAVEEIVRWTTPVIQFCRTPNQDVEVRGQKIRAGQNLTLFYPSANRDEDVFEDPDTFRIDRDPNPHVAFGMGEHVCLGANLARLELRSAFRTLLPRLEHIEVTGKVERLRSSFVGGIKRMPIRYRLRPAA